MPRNDDDGPDYYIVALMLMVFAFILLQWSLGR